MSRTRQVVPVKVTCACGAEFDARNPRAKYCSDRCRKRAQRGGGGEVVALPTPPLDEPEPERGGGVERTTRAALTEAGRIETPMGQACLALARRIDFPGPDTGSALAALVARLESSLSVATRGAGATSAPNALRDELAARRAQGA
jgi:hypothetical protein